MANKLITLDRLTEFKEKCDALYATQDVASSEQAGLVKIGYEENGKNYPVELSEGMMFVNVPWTDTNTTYSAATTSAAGLMSAADKTKLEGIATGANKYTHPSYTAKSSGLYKVTVDGSGHVSATTAVTKADITALGIPGSDTNTTYTGGNGVELSNGQFRADLASYTKDTYAGYAGNTQCGNATPANGKLYSVVLDKNGDLAVAVPWTDTNTTYESKTAASGGTAVSLVTTGEKYNWNNKADASALSYKADVDHTHSTDEIAGLDTALAGKASSTHTHTASLATDTGTSAITLAHGGKYKLTAGGSSVIFTMPADNNTTYSTATSSTAGLVKIGYTASGKNYPVALNNSGQMYVNVPWTDTNTTYSAATSSAAGLMSSSDYSKLANMDYATADDITALFN